MICIYFFMTFLMVQKGSNRRSVAEVQGEPPIGPDRVTVPSLDLFESLFDAISGRARQGSYCGIATRPGRAAQDGRTALVPE